LTEYGNGEQRQDDVLVVSHLSIHFGETRVLTDLGFRVPRGTSLAIIGPNGAGKTVLFTSRSPAWIFSERARHWPGSRTWTSPTP
jgi:ATPase subunit of ABC transporter with duplicated ATPase domains